MAARPPSRGGDRAEGDGGQEARQLGNRGLQQGEEHEHDNVFFCDTRDTALASHCSDGTDPTRQYWSPVRHQEEIALGEETVDRKPGNWGTGTATRGTTQTQ